MSFDKTYPNRKDRRKPYRGAKSVDAHCRNHGSCNYCRSNRTIKRRKIESAMEYEFAFADKSFFDSKHLENIIQ